MSLSAITADLTVPLYSASANVGGKLAQLGARLIGMAAQKMAAYFFGAFIAMIPRRPAPVNSTVIPAVASARMAAGGKLEGFLSSEGDRAQIVSGFSKMFRRGLP